MKNRCKNFPTFLALLQIFLCHLAYAQDLVAPLFNQGIALYSQRDFLGASEYLGQVCDMAPNNTQARFYLAYSLIAIRKFDEAFRHAEILCGQDPQNQQYFALRDQIQKTISASRAVRPSSSGRYSLVPKEAKVSESPNLTKPPPTNPPRERTELDGALDAFDSQNFASASEILDAIIAKDPKNAKALHYRGMVESQQGKYSDARPWFEKAISVKPDMFETFFLLGETLMKEEKLKEAETTFAKAIAIKEDVFALINFAEVKKRLGKMNDAVELYNKALKIDGNVVEAKLNLADVTLDQGKVQEAAQVVNEVLTSDPANSFAHFIKGKILYSGNLIDDSIAELKQAISGSGDNSYYKTFLAKVYLGSGRGNEALEIGNDLLKDDPNSWDARLILAEGLLLNGEVANAQEHAEQAEKVKRSPDLFKLKAKIARRSGNNEKAQEMFKACISSDPKNGQNYLEFALFLEETGDQPFAVEVYKEIKSKFPESIFAVQAQAKLDSFPSVNPPPLSSPPKPNPQGKSLY